jgi:hypothetical protein
MSAQSRNVLFFAKDFIMPSQRKPRQNSPAIPLITVKPRIAAWRRQGRSSMRRREALTAGRDATPCSGRGMADPPRESKQDISTLQRIGHFYFALTKKSLANSFPIEG